MTVPADPRRDRYKRLAEQKMAALDSCPPEVREALKASNYATVDIAVMADLCRSGNAKRVADGIRKDDDDLRKRRTRY